VYSSRAVESRKLYQRFVSIIGQCNILVAANRNTDEYFDPKQGNVAFASSKHGWAFTLPQYARMLVLGGNITASTDDAVTRLWGDSFYSTTRKKWLSDEQAKKEYVNVKRGFTEYVLQSLYYMLHAGANEQINLVDKILAQLRLQLPSEKLDTSKYKKDEIMFNVMNNWFPVSDAIVHLIVLHLPSPVQAQAHRGGP
jgi:elongation factor 2